MVLTTEAVEPGNFNNYQTNESGASRGYVELEIDNLHILKDFVSLFYRLYKLDLVSYLNYSRAFSNLRVRELPLLIFEQRS